MLRFFALLVLLLPLSGALWCCKSSSFPQKETQKLSPEVKYNQEDSLRIDSLLQVFGNFQSGESGQIVEAIGKSWLNTPYVGSTLNICDSMEYLVINTRELDCLTFVENVLALEHVVRDSVNNGFVDFCRELENIRYREGKRQGYVSRLHYYSDWVRDNQRKGLFVDITKELGGIAFPIKVGFMSSHPQHYGPLKHDSLQIVKIREIEKDLNQYQLYYIPKEKVPQIENHIKDGDILGITTNIKGLDMSHTGIAIHIQGRLHMLHASSSFKKVVITEKNLADYLASHSSQTGIVVLRPGCASRP